MKVFKSVSIFLIVSLALFFLVFILVEGVFRVVGIPYKNGYTPNENSFAMFDPELGWSYIPNESTIHEVGGGKIKKPVHFERNGIRVPDSEFQFDSLKPSVLFIGGSFTMGHGLSYEESFVGKFDALDEIKYQVVNMGVQGYGSDQALLALKRHMNKFNAKIVVYTFIEDHILRNGNYDRRMLIPTARFLGTKPKFELNSSKEIYLGKKPLLYKDYIHSYLIDFLKIKIGTILGSFPPFPEELTKAIILEMKRHSNENGAYFIILNWRWSNNSYNKLFQEIDIDVIDTIEKAPQGWEKMVILGGVHPTAEASDHAAQLLLEYFSEKDLL